MHKPFIEKKKQKKKLYIAHTMNKVIDSRIVVHSTVIISGHFCRLSMMKRLDVEMAQDRG